MTIATARLDLVSLSPSAQKASLDRRLSNAAALLGATLPADWPAPHEGVLRRRLAQLEADPTQRPWLRRAMLWDEEDGLELVFERHVETPRPYTPDDTT